MISFKDITLADKDTITSFTMKSDRRNCDLSFSNLCSWRFLYDTKFAVVDNFLVFKFWAGEQLAYMMPIGTGDLKAILRKLIEDADKEKQSFCMLGVCSNMRVDLETTLPSQFVFTDMLHNFVFGITKTNGREGSEHVIEYAAFFTDFFHNSLSSPNLFLNEGVVLAQGL